MKHLLLSILGFAVIVSTSAFAMSGAEPPQDSLDPTVPTDPPILPPQPDPSTTPVPLLIDLKLNGQDGDFTMVRGERLIARWGIFGVEKEACSLSVHFLDANRRFILMHQATHYQLTQSGEIVLETYQVPDGGQMVGYLYCHMNGSIVSDMVKATVRNRICEPVTIFAGRMMNADRTPDVLIPSNPFPAGASLKAVNITGSLSYWVGVAPSVSCRTNTPVPNAPAGYYVPIVQFLSASGQVISETMLGNLELGYPIPAGTYQIVGRYRDDNYASNAGSCRFDLEIIPKCY